MWHDDVLIGMYGEWDVPCDELVSNPDLLRTFTRDYQRRTGADVEARDVGRRLLTLRKRGEAKGGLPRLRRQFHGRQSSREGAGSSQQLARLPS